MKELMDRLDEMGFYEAEQEITYNEGNIMIKSQNSNLHAAKIAKNDE